MTQTQQQARIQILISGTGSNALNIAKEVQQGVLKGLGEITQVISNRPTAKGLAASQEMGINTACVDHKDYETKADFEAALIAKIEEKPYDIIVLAGFMRILSAEFVSHFAGKVINIHPSLLPDYKGLNTHQRVLDAGEKHHGVTVHLVIPDLDAGPIIGQAMLNINEDDSAESLHRRIQAMEYWLYPQCLRMILSGEIQLEADRVVFKAQQLQKTATGVQPWQEEMILNSSAQAQ
ncbi:MAG: phosphoribosylglycinamide formyltransferase [Pseudomonadota bacterium]|nr:phosphoribosylglycinamide formyltransferase [Gammaproteobacteria bacterium]MEC8010778.1 phosphoribosylglycinamide formyltransferase [Pseudomonadota bacterium]HBF06727.1 phosphoribosylglycinamide formyltransferase [Gammaproteobacteria bacterium]|tara:strand:- start:263 stop:970 length:708 start_codon:yes stop_codon:yes gene_type:complete